VVAPRFRRFVLALWIPALLLGGVETVEILLQIRSAATEYFREASERKAPTEQQKIKLAYQPFAVQHLHPFYSFFFPLQPQDRLALANPVCSIDADGFREPGPAAAGSRKLAVLLGGSSAFGFLASSNDTTITAYLNRRQSEYFFVSAGVPSWNSTQELARMALQIADLHPALVITYDGANDASLVDQGLDARHQPRYPAGTPEHFDELEAIVDTAARPLSRITLASLFPEIANRLEKYVFTRTGDSPPLDPVILQAAARRYTSNLLQVQVLARGAGARFLAVYQPIYGLHHRLAPDADGADADARAFHDAALTMKPAALDLVDFSAIFDDVAAVTDSSVFLDDVHLSDRGSEMLANQLLRVLSRAQ
jgi:lysophospholipase L1-like esterase